ncbi:MAG TPA: 4Fe-4S binding protein [Candidatus Acidoferrum sp.]|nr:4Fe-4S binding protein [Candidatus Acidoferrum sp.]
MSTLAPALPEAVQNKQAATPTSTKPPKAKKKLVRRADRDYSQLVRRGYQAAFLLLNVWLGGIFYFWVRGLETGTAASVAEPPAGIEGWLPIAGLMNLKYFLVSGRVPPIHPAAMFLLITFLVMSFLLRKAFCSWLCPIGTISEYLGLLGQKLFKRNFRIWRWLDIPLRGLKYLLLGFFVWAISSMSAAAIAGFMQSDYGVVAGVKMLNFFRFLGETGLIVLGVLVLASVFVQNFWCRYLCPYGALLGFASLLSPLRIRREPEPCIDCAKCAKVCPSNLPVDQLITIKSAECTGCLECVAICPAEGALHLALPRIAKTSSSKPPWRIPAWAMAAGVAFLFFGIVGYAKAVGLWDSHIPAAMYRQLVPHADTARHPMPGDPEISR